MLKSIKTDSINGTLLKMSVVFFERNRGPLLNIINIKINVSHLDRVKQKSSERKILWAYSLSLFVCWLGEYFFLATNWRQHDLSASRTHQRTGFLFQARPLLHRRRASLLSFFLLPPRRLLPGCCRAFFSFSFARSRGLGRRTHPKIGAEQDKGSLLQFWPGEGGDVQGAALVAAASVRCRINSRLRQHQPARW